MTKEADGEMDFKIGYDRALAVAFDGFRCGLETFCESWRGFSKY